MFLVSKQMINFSITTACKFLLTVRAYLLFFVFVFLFSCSSESSSCDPGNGSFYESSTIYGQVNGLPGNKVLLFELYGDEVNILDSAMADYNGSFELYFPSQREHGLYRLAMGKNVQPGYHDQHRQHFDIIWDGNTVVFHTDYTSPVDSMKILLSDENTGYYQLLKTMSDYYQQISVLSSALVHYPDDDNFYRRLERQYRRVQNRRSNYIDNLTKRNEGKIFASIARFHKMPRISSSATAGGLEEMRDDYFFKGQFADAVILRTDLIPAKLIRYLSLYKAEAGDDHDDLQESLIEAVDVIMQHAGENEDVYYFVLEYLINGFESMGGMEMVAGHLISHYLHGDRCPRGHPVEPETPTPGLSEGGSVPMFTFTAVDGRFIDLRDISADYTLILFWGSWCPHCTHLMDDLYELYTRFRREKEGFLEVVAIGIEDDREMWLKSIESGGYDWINYSSLERWDCPIARQYGPDGTPTMILVDSEKRFIQEPLRIRSLNRYLSRQLRQ